jgi:hypothetical protein
MAQAKHIQHGIAVSRRLLCPQGIIAQRLIETTSHRELAIVVLQFTELTPPTVMPSHHAGERLWVSVE